MYIQVFDYRKRKKRTLLRGTKKKNKKNKIVLLADGCAPKQSVGAPDRVPSAFSLRFAGGQRWTTRDGGHGERTRVCTRERVR